MAKKTRKKTTKRKTKKKSNLKRILKVSFVFFLIILIYILWCAITIPDIKQAINRTRTPSVTIIASNGNEIRSYGAVYSQIIHANDLPQHITDAIVYTEDRRFYSHFGFDIISFTRAMFANIFAGSYVQGGSTITQQVAKNLFLTNKKNIRRKVQELLLAFWLEYKFSKDQILSLYLNRVYFGNGAYGIEAASNKYFQKTTADLNLLESAVLAGLLKAPSRYNPIASKSKALERAKIVLNILRENHLLTEKTFQLTLKQSLGQQKPSKVKSGDYFADTAYSEMIDIIGEPTKDIYVMTTLHQSLQEKSSQVLQQILSSSIGSKASQGAIVIMDKTGGIKALVGGTSYNKSQFNRATQALRQAGSSFKLFVYLTALQQGWKEQDLISDSPINIKGWTPENHDKKHYGDIELINAFAKSLNVATVNLAKSVGINKIIKTAKKLGITTPINKDLSISLGSSSVKVIDMAAAYTTIANGGFSVWPHTIKEIYSLDGFQLYQRENDENIRVLDEKIVTSMKNLLAEVVKTGTGRFVKINRDFYAKTGTSQDNRDAWFIGFDNKYTVAVWIGNDDNSPMNNVYGSGLPAKIWQQIMR